MERRKFLTLVGVGCAATSLPACNQTPVASGFTPVGKVETLDTTGQILDKSAAVGPISIVRTPDKTGTIFAVNPTCTHDGCTVNWKVQENKYICPCHGAEFAPDGKLLKGPAKTPLPSYTIKTEGVAILVKAP